MAIERRAAQATTAAELQAQIDAAKDGEVVHVGPGKIRGRVVIDKPITLRGSGADRTILDGRDRGATISIDADHGQVRIEELAIMGGRSSFGGGISIENGAEVHVVGCLLEKNAAKSGRGGAIAIEHGALYISECTIVQNRALLGGGVFVGGDAHAEISASIVAENLAVRGGGIALVDGAELDVWTSRLEVNSAEVEGHHVYSHGTTTRRPRLLLSNALLSSAGAAGLAISNHARFRADVTIDNSLLGREIVQSVVVG
ncbi:hypothetical protein L6R52_15225 [Myxococcota bacterium]|nr:hypothetical protein [Myxococcota bacterium]